MGTLAISAMALAPGTAGRARPEIWCTTRDRRCDGLTAVVPALAAPLVYDAPGCIFAVRNDAMVEMSGDGHFDCDATSVLIKARSRRRFPIQTRR